jgi:hypothetical protein
MKEEERNYIKDIIKSSFGAKFAEFNDRGNSKSSTKEMSLGETLKLLK